MLWVVIGHSVLEKVPETWPCYVATLVDFAYSFHMALFIFTSGYLFYMTRLAPSERKWTYPTIIADKAKRLIIPGIVFSLLAFVLKVAFPGEMARKVGLEANDIIHIILYPNDSPLKEMWFIVTLFWMFLLSPVWKLSLTNRWTILGTIVALAVLHFVHIDTELLCIDRFCFFAIWFYLGIILCKTALVDTILHKKSLLVLAVGIGIYAIGVVTIPVFKIIGGIVLSIGLALTFDAYIPKIFSSFRNYTYQIFLMGIFCQIFVCILYAYFGSPIYVDLTFARIDVCYLAAFLLCIAVGLYIPVIISKLIEKTGSKPLLLCIGLKPKKQN